MKKFLVLLSILVLFGCAVEDDFSQNPVGTFEKSREGLDAFDLSVKNVVSIEGVATYVVRLTYVNASELAIAMSLPIWYNSDLVTPVSYELGSIMDCQEGSMGFIIIDPGNTENTSICDFAIFGHDYWYWDCDEKPDNIYIEVTYESNGGLSFSKPEFYWSNEDDPVRVADENGQPLEYELFVNGRSWSY